ncbi:MAG: S8/S53 family peptidase [Trueperaceae bacterium]|nr:S8/S53 family peptidase [Trueperaceae bacterium]
MRGTTAVLVLAVLVWLSGCGSGGGTTGGGGVDVEVRPAERTLAPGTQETFAVTIDRAGGVEEAVELQLASGAAGIEGTFDPDPVDGEASTLTLRVGDEVPIGTYDLNVEATAGRASGAFTLRLAVAEEAPPTTVRVDPALAPHVETLPPLGDGRPRPVTTLTDARGIQADFVADELVLMSDDPDELDDFLARRNGELLRSLGPADGGVPGGPTLHLVRVDPQAAGLRAQALVDDLAAIDPEPRADLAFASQAGLDLVAVAAAERASGVQVGVNWVGEGHTFTDALSEEAPTMSGSDGRYTSGNAFDWSYMGAFAGSLDIGAPEAWWALEAWGLLDQRVKIAVLDGGFFPNDDFPQGWESASVVPGLQATFTQNAGSCGGDNPCPFHGTNVALTAAGVPDNGFGTAGSAGPIADLVMIHTTPDFFMGNLALAEALARGADIVNMSFGARVPAPVAWSVEPFNASTAAASASGALVFAAAGNDAQDVDAESCFIFCWEEAWHTPCENVGVTCVGGIRMASQWRHVGSNWGDEQVDIYAPFVVFTPDDPQNPESGVMGVTGGTSVASPFAAGVAALIWAAEPSLDAGQVLSVLVSTAHPSNDPAVNRYVNAIGAVKSRLGNTPPKVVILQPGPEVTYGFPATFEATAIDLEDGEDCCVVRWTSDVDGFLGTGSGALNALSAGVHQVTASATDSDGVTGTDTVTVTALNDPPLAEIVFPTEGETLASNKTWVFNAQASDVNQLGVPCEAFAWESDHPDDPDLEGCEPTVAFSTLGARTWTVTATDDQGATGTAEVTIDVTQGPELWVSITHPAPGDVLAVGDIVGLGGEISQVFETPATYEWAVSTNQVDYETVASGDVLTMIPSGEKGLGQEFWEVTFAYEDDDVWIRLTIDAPNGTKSAVITPPVHVAPVPK